MKESKQNVCVHLFEMCSNSGSEKDAWKRIQKNVATVLLAITRWTLAPCLQHLQNSAFFLLITKLAGCLNN